MSFIGLALCRHDGCSCDELGIEDSTRTIWFDVKADEE